MAVDWNGIRWPGHEVAILASGSSLNQAQCDAVRRWQGDKRHVIVINTTFRMYPTADVLYACDWTWWKVHRAEVEKDFRGQLWTQDKKALEIVGMHFVESSPNPGLGKRPGVIHQGQNSGYQALNLAYQAGVKRMALLGFDMHGQHWHGDHPSGLPNPKPHLFAAWVKNFDRLATDLAAEGVDVVNCSPGTALECFKKATIEDAL